MKKGVFRYQKLNYFFIYSDRAEIILQNCDRAVLDKEDVGLVCDYTWHAYKSKKRVYVQTNINGKTIKLHRVILTTNKEIDHINQNGLDNRKRNLRSCSIMENCWNRGTQKRGNSTSKFKGVRKRNYSNKFRARITVNKQTINIGSFDSEIDAAIAYDAAAEKHFGKFAKTNRSLGLL